MTANTRRLFLIALPICALLILAALILPPLSRSRELAKRAVWQAERQSAGVAPALRPDAVLIDRGGNMDRHFRAGELDTGVPVTESRSVSKALAAVLPKMATAERKVVYTAGFHMLVGDVALAQERTRKLADEMGGYMQSLDGPRLTIRVLAEQFEAAVERLAELGTVVRRHIEANDVTEQFYDLEVRLKNARALAERLRALLARADDMADALAAEKELARVTTDIERMEGRLNRLRNRIAFATITVTFDQPGDVPPPELTTHLPFAWLHELGLDTLLAFPQSYRD